LTSGIKNLPGNRSLGDGKRLIIKKPMVFRKKALFRWGITSNKGVVHQNSKTGQ
jgi:hypothetical protein